MIVFNLPFIGVRSQILCSAEQFRAFAVVIFSDHLTIVNFIQNFKESFKICCMANFHFQSLKYVLKLKWALIFYSGMF